MAPHLAYKQQIDRHPGIRQPRSIVRARHIKVVPDDAGCTCAPESVYEEKTAASDTLIRKEKAQPQCDEIQA